MAEDATEEDVALIRETCAIVSEKGAKIVAAGKSRMSKQEKRGRNFELLGKRSFKI